MSSEPFILPIATVQPDFLAVISDVREGLVPDDKFWLSCYKTGEPSVHGKVHITLDEVDRNLVHLDGRHGVQIDHNNEVSRMRCPTIHIVSVRYDQMSEADDSFTRPRMRPHVPPYICLKLA